MKNIDLNKLNYIIENFVNERDWDQFHTIKNLSMALAVESSELMEIFQWLSDEQSNALCKNEKSRENLEDEVADVFIYLLRIVAKTGINLEEAVLKKMEKNALKYPVELAKGNAKKYTDL
jgi:dCTP diphosphatase